MNETIKIAIVYVGNKPSAHDNVARSGKTWTGYGDCQEVTPAQAKQLLKYPDQWALADQDDAVHINGIGGLVGKDEDGQSVDVSHADLQKPIEKMSKAELTALAADRWGKELDPTLPKKQMIDQVEEWMEHLDLSIGKA